MSFDDLDISLLRRRRGEKWAMYPEDVLPVWVADMDFPAAEPIQAVLRHALETGDIGYPINPTPSALPRVFCERVQERFGWKVEPERVEVLTDVVQGLCVALQTFSQPGEGAIVQTPLYPPFIQSIHDMGRHLIVNELVRGNDHYEIDFDALDASVDRGTRLLMLCNPHNPSGRVFTRAELERLAEFALRNHLTVVSDEIHAELIYPGHEHIPIASLGPEIEAETITLMSATKAFNIAGLRCAIAAFGSEHVHSHFNELNRHIRGGLGTLGLQATEAAWTLCDDWQRDVLAYLDANRKHVASYLDKNLPDIKHFIPEATYLYWMDCRQLGVRDPYWHFLKKGKVALTSGKPFGPGGKGFTRINFATSRAILNEALERMVKALAS